MPDRRLDALRVKSDPGQIRKSRGRKAVREPVKDLRRSKNATSQDRENFQQFPFWIDTYCSQDTEIHLHLFGWRRATEGPGINVCASFQRDRKAGMVLEPIERLKTWQIKRLRNGLYDVKLSVLVQIVDICNVPDNTAKFV